MAIMKTRERNRKSIISKARKEGYITNDEFISCIEDLVAWSNMAQGSGVIYQNGKIVNLINKRTTFSGKYIELTRDLNFKSNLSGRSLNRLCKNSWDRCLFENKLKMLSKLHGYEVVEINPCYTSQLGNIIYGNENTPDMVAASIEIARRGFKKSLRFTYRYL